MQQASPQAATKTEGGLGYFPAVDGLRAIAVASVMLFHLNGTFLPGGFVGVDIFFVISGFVVTASVAHLKFKDLLSFQSYFYARRIIRIYPALLIVLAVTCLLRAMFIPDAFLSKAMDHVGLGAYFGVSNIVLAFTVNDYFSPSSTFNPYTHTWSLGVEEQFYLIFPFLLYALEKVGSTELRRRMVFAAIALLCCASLAASYVLTSRAWPQAFYMLPSRFWELGAGMLLCLGVNTWRHPLQSSTMGGWLLTGAALAATAASFMIPSDSGFPFPMALVPVLAAVGLIAVVVARPDGLLGRILSWPPVVFVGRASYSLYLWHWPIYVLMRWTVGLDLWWQYALAVGATVAAAFASYLLIETPLRRAAPIRRLPRPILILTGLGVILLCAGGSHELLKHKSSLALSRTKDMATWYSNDAGLKGPVPGCGLRDRLSNAGSESLDDLQPVKCLAPSSSGRLLVVGDSHAGAYKRLLWRLALDTSREVRIYSRTGCPFLKMAPSSRADPRCAAWEAEVANTIASEARPGDIIFLPSLRVPRYRDQWGGPLTPTTAADPATPDRQAIEARAVAILDRLTSTGAHVVFEAPTPVFKAPPFRCADWYDAHNPICADGFSISTSELELRRAPALQAIRDVVAIRPAVSLWDPLPILCPMARCDAFQRGRPILFDGDHLSGWGNDILFADFRGRAETLWNTRKPTRDAVAAPGGDTTPGGQGPGPGATG